MYSEIGLGTTSIIAALLHDVVEDTEHEIRILKEILWKKGCELLLMVLPKFLAFSNTEAHSRLKISERCYLRYLMMLE